MRQLTVCGVLAGLVVLGWTAQAEGICSICRRYIEEGQQMATAVDQMTLKERVVCLQCTTIEEVCFLCAMPTLAENRKVLSDGRYYCGRDAELALFSGLEVERVCRETVVRMERPLARFMTFPGRLVEWRIEDLTLRSEAQAAGSSACHHPALRFDILKSDGIEEGGTTRAKYRLTLLNGLPRGRVAAAAAHGMAHAWLGEHMATQRVITAGTVAGFCDLIAEITMEAIGEPDELERIRQLDKSQGQLTALRQVYGIYDLYRILEWMKYGADSQLVAGDDSRIRKLDENLVPKRRVPQQVIPPSPAPVRGPPELVLRTILGTGAKRLALINDATLAVGEEGRAHVGLEVVRLKCLEIGGDFVRVQVDGGEEQVVRLPGRE